MEIQHAKSVLLKPHYELLDVSCCLLAGEKDLLFGAFILLSLYKQYKQVLEIYDQWQISLEETKSCNVGVCKIGVVAIFFATQCVI